MTGSSLRVGVVGSRKYPNKDLVLEILKDLITPAHTVVTGGAVGVDRWAASYARSIECQVAEHLPNWKTHGKRAGFLRNSIIVGDSDVLVAFWDGESKGTVDSIEKALAAGKAVMIWLPDGTYLSGGKYRERFNPEGSNS